MSISQPKTLLDLISAAPAEATAILLPDQVQPQVYEAEIAPNMEPGAVIVPVPVPESAIVSA